MHRNDPYWLVTKFPGHCASCGGSIARNTVADWHPNGEYLVCKHCAHRSCARLNDTWDGLSTIEAARSLRPAPDYDPHIDYPERYTDGRPI